MSLRRAVRVAKNLLEVYNAQEEDNPINFRKALGDVHSEDYDTAYENLTLSEQPEFNSLDMHEVLRQALKELVKESAQQS